MSPPTLDPGDLRDVDRAILDELGEGERTKGFLVDETGYHRNTIGGRLNVLEAGGCIECIHQSTALYGLKTDPRK